MCNGDVLGLACYLLPINYASIAAGVKQALFGPSWKELLWGHSVWYRQAVLSKDRMSSFSLRHARRNSAVNREVIEFAFFISPFLSPVRWPTICIPYDAG